MRTIKFLGIEWSKKDLEVLANVLDIGIDHADFSTDKEERAKLLKASANIREIIE